MGIRSTSNPKLFVPFLLLPKNKLENPAISFLPENLKTFQFLQSRGRFNFVYPPTTFFFELYISLISHPQMAALINI